MRNFYELVVYLLRSIDEFIVLENSLFQQNRNTSYMDESQETNGCIYYMHSSYLILMIRYYIEIVRKLLLSFLSDSIDPLVY